MFVSFPVFARSRPTLAASTPSSSPPPSIRASWVLLWAPAVPHPRRRRPPVLPGAWGLVPLRVGAGL